jgi:hypothetical protein
MKESKEELNWKTPPYRKKKIMYNTQKFEFIKQHLFWTVLDRLFLFKLLLCLLYQISEHIIVQITFIIILVVSLLSLSRNKTNSHFLNNWQSWDNTTSQADRIWSEHLIWPWKATIWIRFIKGKLVFLKWKAMRATSEGENEANILMSSCFKRQDPHISISFHYYNLSCDSNSLLSLYLFSSFHTYNAVSTICQILKNLLLLLWTSQSRAHLQVL